jgi:predicted  nucleic acid-binding Zn-ribbon protein
MNEKVLATETIQELRAKAKDLQDRIDALNAQHREIMQQAKNIGSTINRLACERGQIMAAIDRKVTPPQVSDHAVIRYLERRYGFSFEDVRKEMLPPGVVRAIQAGADHVQALGGRMAIKNNTVVTFMD